MSLSQQLQRVDGSQNETLKAILRALGIQVYYEKVDQLPALAAAISNKVNPENILSSATAVSLGLPANATANDAFSKLGGSCIIGSYIGNTQLSQSISLGFKPKAVIIAHCGSFFEGSAEREVIQNSLAIDGHPSTWTKGVGSGESICEITEIGFTVYNRTGFSNGASSSMTSPSSYYNYIALR